MGGNHTQHLNMKLGGSKDIEVHEGPDSLVHVHDRDAKTKATLDPQTFVERYKEAKRQLLEDGADAAKIVMSGGDLRAQKAPDYDDSGKIVYSLEPKNTGFEPLDKFVEDLEGNS